MHTFFKKIAKDIYQVQLPLPFALRIVNVYLVQGEHGWTIFDTGLNLPEARERWIAAFDALGISADGIQQIILTHYHPDHYGLAGWLQAYTGETGHAPVPVKMSARDAELADEIWRHKKDQVQMLHRYFLECGMPETLSHELTRDIQKLQALIEPQPQKIEHLEPGETLDIGRYRFQILHTPGHSDGHLIFWDPHEKIALCGDQILLNITPNISQWPNTEADPLGRYLDSLNRLAYLNVEIAFPGHGPNIEDWTGRLRELKQHHDERLSAMLEAVNGSTSIFQVSREVFEIDTLSHHEIRFAIAETRAHLEYLVKAGQLYHENPGIWLYRRATEV